MWHFKCMSRWQFHAIFFFFNALLPIFAFKHFRLEVAKLLFILNPLINGLDLFYYYLLLHSKIRLKNMEQMKVILLKLRPWSKLRNDFKLSLYWRCRKYCQRCHHLLIVKNQRLTYKIALKTYIFYHQAAW